MQPTDSGKGYSYSGNDDFRGYLATVDPYALSYTGNNGGIDVNKVNTTGADTKQQSYAPGQGQAVQNYVTGLYNQWYGMKNAAPAGGGGNNAAAGGGGGGGYSSPYATPDYNALANAYSAQFDAQDQGLQKSMNLNQEIANTGKDRVDNSYGVQKGGLDQQYGYGNANLDMSQNKLDVSKANSFRDLGNSLRLASQGYSNQLGINGAGDSSAADMLNYALTQQGNRQSNDINQNVTQQQTGLNLQRTQLKGSYDQNVKMLDDWHANQLAAIIDQYSTMQNQMESARTQAKGQKAIDLAYIGKGQAANQAVSQMQALNATYQSHMNQLQYGYSQAQAPTAQLGNDLTQQFNVQPVSAGNIQAASLANNQASYTPTYQQANVKKDSTNPYA